jgi:hypothetical protein
MAAKLKDKMTSITMVRDQYLSFVIFLTPPPPPHPYLSLPTTFKNCFFATTLALAFYNYFPNCEGYYCTVDAVVTLSAGTFGLKGQ